MLQIQGETYIAAEVFKTCLGYLRTVGEDSGSIYEFLTYCSHHVISAEVGSQNSHKIQDLR